MPLPQPAPAAPPAFVLAREAALATPVVFASPHSGRWYPDDLVAASALDPLTLRASEDALVDRLAEGVTAHGAALLTCAAARAYVDVNRDPRELDPALVAAGIDLGPAMASPRVQAGLGVVPRMVGDGRIIHCRPLTRAEIEGRLEAVHRPYHAALASLLEEARARFGAAILIDLHSMPSAAGALEARRGRGRPQMVLGDRHGAACGRALNLAVRTQLEKAGYRVALNSPYAGGFVTQTWGRPAEDLHALQIEIDRGLYLNEATLEPVTGYDRLKADLERLAAMLCTDWRRLVA
ncbi:MAG TPA: N-formylglutamate amidohydrolase [Caulobacteraceae bacterium]|jgi:N-formylglutamate amidohydrolase